MTLRAGHGKGAGVPRIEVLPADELPQGVQAPGLVPAGRQRNDKGQWIAGATHAQSKGGRSRARTIKLAHTLGLGDLVASDRFAPFIDTASDFLRTHAAAIAERVGGGECGTGPSSFIATAALQLAASRYFFARAAETMSPDMFTLGSKLANESRQNLLAAHELAAKEAPKGAKGGSSVARLRAKHGGAV